MKLRYLLFLVLILILSCDKEEEEAKEAPSVIRFEVQTIGELTGGVFGEEFILTRTIREYAADGEHNVMGGIGNLPTGEDVISIYGFGVNIHPHVQQIVIRIPNEGVKTYNFNPETSEEKNFWMHLETNYSTELRGGNDGIFYPSTEMSVTIKEMTEGRIKGSFTGSLVCCNVEMRDGSKYMTIDQEITNTYKPVINGTFDIFRYDN